MEQLSQSGSRGRRRTGNEPAPHERVKGERRANEPRRTASPHRASANNAGRANTPAAEQTPARPKSRYIPALDGLRTLAVVAVVLYHLNLTWAQGGLLGVTIFFVLSGYLITRLLLNEVAKTGRIDLKSFWIRRIRRLVPAVVTVVVVTCALCTVFNHVMLTKMRPDILPSLLFFNNWWQIAQNVSYFNALGDPSPLTHFWSLAIEEQFYLLWPLALSVGFMLLAEPSSAVWTGHGRCHCLVRLVCLPYWRFATRRVLPAAFAYVGTGSGRTGRIYSLESAFSPSRRALRCSRLAGYRRNFHRGLLFRRRHRLS